MVKFFLFYFYKIKVFLYIVHPVFLKTFICSIILDYVEHGKILNPEKLPTLFN
jgi:hypothetical protein